MSEQEGIEPMSERPLIIDIDPERSERYYRRMRRRVVRWLADRRSDKYADILLLAPDMFVLLGRLMLDSRVSARDRAIVAGALVYFLSPLDIVPDFLLPLGVVDDVIAAVIALNNILNRTDPAIIREHWEGDEDILATIERILEQADKLVGSGMLRRVGNALQKRTPRA